MENSRFFFNLLQYSDIILSVSFFFKQIWYLSYNKSILLFRLTLKIYRSKKFSYFEAGLKKKTFFYKNPTQWVFFIKTRVFFWVFSKGKKSKKLYGGSKIIFMWCWAHIMTTAFALLFKTYFKHSVMSSIDRAKL